MRKPMDPDVPGRMGRPGVLPGAVGLGTSGSGAVGPGKWTRVEAGGVGPGGPATAASAVATAPASSTAPLSPTIRARLEAAFRTDLSAVRVGEDPSVAAMGARAHARGLHLLFAPGAYRPDTPAGDELIAHEVAHLLQQAERPVPTSGDVGGTPVHTDRSLERDADVRAAGALRGDTLPAAAAPRPSSGPVQGMFEDLEHLLDPVLDAAADLWDSIVAGGGSSGGGGSGSGHAMHVGDVGVIDDPDARILRAGKDKSPYFTVRVPIDVAAIPPEMRDKVTPGKTIVGSSTTGFPKAGDVYKECAALRYISKDPVLLSRFMYAGEHSYQHFLIKGALASMQKAEDFSFLVGDGDDAQRIGWTRLISPLGADWLAATQAVIAYRYHASASTYEALKVKAAGFYRDTFGADRDPDDLGTSDRKTIGRFVAWQLKPGKYAAYRKQFPSVADDVFPPAKGDGAAAPGDAAEPGDGPDAAADDGET